MRVLLLSLFMLVPLASHAIVDMKSANYSESWTDLVVPGVGYDLRINRTYNSRTLFNGLFWFGWWSDYGKKKEVTPQRFLRLTQCGGGKEKIFNKKKFKPVKNENTNTT